MSYTYKAAGGENAMWVTNTWSYNLETAATMGLDRVGVIIGGSEFAAWVPITWFLELKTAVEV
jgi:hypothetical protein